MSGLDEGEGRGTNTPTRQFDKWAVVQESVVQPRSRTRAQSQWYREITSALGVDAGQYIVDTLTKKYGMEGIPGDETSVNRIGGVTSATGKSADIKVIARQPADYRRPKAYAVMQDQGSANPASVVVQLSASTTEISMAC